MHLLLLAMPGAPSSVVRHLLLEAMHLLLLAMPGAPSSVALVTTSKALVTTSDALVPPSNKFISVLWSSSTPFADCAILPTFIVTVGCSVWQLKLCVCDHNSKKRRGQNTG